MGNKIRSNGDWGKTAVSVRSELREHFTSCRRVIYEANADESQPASKDVTRRGKTGSHADIDDPQLRARGEGNMYP